MFITMPKIFASMGIGRIIGVLFFTLVLFAALTSSIALTEAAVSTICDEFKWSRTKCTTFMAVIMIALGTLSCLGYGPLSFITIIGMPFLDFFDFLTNSTNSVMMPIAAFAICVLVTKCIGLSRLEQEVEMDGHPFRRKKVFSVVIRYIAPVFVLIILLSSIANAFGLISL